MYKKILYVSILTFGLSDIALAANSGIYFGGAAGWGFTNYKNNATVNTGISGDAGIVSRLFTGWDINKHFAIEAGYSYFFSKVSGYTDRDGDYVGKVRTQTFDLYGKGKIPVNTSIIDFDVYGKVGAGYLIPTSHANAHLNVAFGAGVDYSVASDIVANVEWTRIAGCQSGAESYIPNTDAFMLGIRYKFDL